MIVIRIGPDLASDRVYPVSPYLKSDSRLPGAVMYSKGLSLYLGLLYGLIKLYFAVRLGTVLGGVQVDKHRFCTDYFTRGCPRGQSVDL